MDFGLAVDQCNLQRGRQVGIGVGVSIKSQRSALDTQIQWPNEETEIDVLGNHASIDRQARAHASDRVIVFQLHCHRLRGRGQVHAKAKLGIRTEGQADVALPRGIQQTRQALRQLEACHLGHILEVQGQREGVLIAQFQIEIDEELVFG